MHGARRQSESIVVQVDRVDARAVAWRADGQQTSRASRAWSSAQPGAEPLLYTVEEAAALLRISRTLAYEMAGQYVASCGQAGLPVIRLRKRLRVPRWALLELALHGRVVSISDRVAGTGERPPRRVTARRADRSQSTAGRDRLSAKSSAHSRPSRSLAKRPVSSFEQLTLAPGN